MSRCTITWADDSRVVIAGVIDETSAFEDTVARFGAQVFIDFSGVTRINSCGVRQWTRAIYQCKTLLRYVNAPSLMVDHFSMVPEFLGPHSVVDTFEGRYVCDACGHEDVVMLALGKDIQPGLAEYTDGPKRNCPKCAAVLEFDHNPEIYLDFLRILAPLPT